MADDKKIETLESELKLIKGELKEGLVSVRDFLLNLKLPASSMGLNLGPDEETLLTLGGGLSMDSGRRRVLAALPGMAVQEEPTAPQRAQTEAPAEQPQYREAPPGAPPARGFSAEIPHYMEAPPEAPPARGFSAEIPHYMEAPTEAPQFEQVETPFPSVAFESPEQRVPYSEGVRYEEAPERSYGDRMGEQVQPTPQVNMLANLLRWVSAARGKLGIEQLPTFLEVYGVCGSLSLELKEVILHLADLVEQQPEDIAVADVWSQLILELHGILAGGGTPIQPLSTFWNGGEGDTEVNEAAMELDNLKDESAAPEEGEPMPLQKDKPVRLKLVVPVGDGVEREIDLGELGVSLDHEENGGDSSDNLSTT